MVASHTSIAVTLTSQVDPIPGIIVAEYRAADSVHGDEVTLTTSTGFADDNATVSPGPGRLDMIGDVATTFTFRNRLGGPAAATAVNACVYFGLEIGAGSVSRRAVLPFKSASYRLRATYARLRVYAFRQETLSDPTGPSFGPSASGRYEAGGHFAKGGSNAPSHAWIWEHLAWDTSIVPPFSFDAPWPPGADRVRLEPTFDFVSGWGDPGGAVVTIEEGGAQTLDVPGGIATPPQGVPLNDQPDIGGSFPTSRSTVTVHTPAKSPATRVAIGWRIQL